MVDRAPCVKRKDVETMLMMSCAENNAQPAERKVERPPCVKRDGDEAMLMMMHSQLRGRLTEGHLSEIRRDDYADDHA